MQAHHNALTGGEEFVAEALVSFDKLGVLVHELCAVEVWREFVYEPHMKEAVTAENTYKFYMAMYHEASLINLLECVLFNEAALEAAGDAALDLVDYCHRKLMFLNTSTCSL
jgi:hypothetical protein